MYNCSFRLVNKLLQQWWLNNVVTQLLSSLNNIVDNVVHAGQLNVVQASSQAVMTGICYLNGLYHYLSSRCRFIAISYAGKTISQLYMIIFAIIYRPFCSKASCKGKKELSFQIILWKWELPAWLHDQYLFVKLN